MLPTKAELERAFLLTYRLARFDFTAATLYPRDAATAWRSFVVVPLLLLLLMYLNWPENNELFEKTTLTPLTFGLLGALQFLVSLYAFYLVVFRLARRIGIPGRIPLYITVQNWISLPVWLLVAGIHLFASRLHLTEALAAWLDIFIYAIMMVMSWSATIATLHLRPLPAFALCLLELLFSRLVQQVFAIILVLTLAPH